MKTTRVWNYSPGEPGVATKDLPRRFFQGEAIDIRLDVESATFPGVTFTVSALHPQSSAFYLKLPPTEMVPTIVRESLTHLEGLEVKGVPISTAEELLSRPGFNALLGEIDQAAATGSEMLRARGIF